MPASAEQYIHDLCERLMDPVFAGFIDAPASTRKEILDYGDAHAAQWGYSLDSESLSRFRGVLENRHALAEYYQEEIAAPLRRAALSHLGEDAEPVRNIPVGLLPLLTFDACAGIAPSGEKFIALDFGLGMCCTFLMELFGKLRTWGSDWAHDPGHSAEEYAAGIASLAYFSVTGSRDALLVALRLHDPAATHAKGYAASGLVARTWVLLHEYQHILLGHLDHAEVAHLDLSADEQIPIMSYQHSLEMAADRAALLTFISHARASLSAYSFVESLGPLLRFMRLREVVRSLLRPAPPHPSHPGAEERWRAALAVFVAEFPETEGLADWSCGLLDGSFDAIEKDVRTQLYRSQTGG
ncbi:MAG: hypothetical protein JSW71_14245 [Gemmatimonadota bacterium]|nr:MAG: hypothetical protein JSW71_14245 [Gemmatimonadota bacterium]